jgi:putative ABC transport system ATP-binding protein
VSEARPILEADAVGKSFRTGGGEITVLREASLALYPGQITSIIGPSGSGKTTMLMIAGLLDAPDSGEVRFRGKRVSHPGVRLERLRDIRRNHIGFVFQKANLIPFLNAVENVAVSLEIGGKRPAVARRKAVELLAALGLEHRLTNMPRQLSGGEQQRVAIARAFANDPVLLFADEPTAALDPSRAQQIMMLFRTLAQASNVAVCVVSHDLRWEDHADNVVVFEDGRTRLRRNANA